MSNSTPKRVLSSLMSKFRRSGSDESSSYFSAEEAIEESAEPRTEEGDISPVAEEEEVQVAPLAMAPEDKPESWLGQFLLELDLAGVSRRGTIAGAKLDTNL